jgi:arabinan endo-1,5-alpha-L-arabinosidase
VSPQPFAGAQHEALPAPVPVAGTWQVLRFAPESADLVPAAVMELECTNPDQATYNGSPVHVRLRVTRPSGPDHALGPDGAGELDAVVFGSWDWARKRPALSFSGIDRHGVAWSGTREGLL